VDLNLLRIFVAVYEVRTLTAAAERLFVSQPAVSQSLAKLRRDLDDPLFDRQGRVMVPSRLAETLYPEFRAALARIDSALDEVRGFDPSSSDRRFRIALSELGEIGYLPAILNTVRAIAPRVGVEVVPLDTAALPDWLSRGTVDLAITSSPVSGNFERSTVKSERYVALMSVNHPFANRELTLEAYANADHVTVVSDSGKPKITAALENAGIVIVPRVTVNHFLSLPGLLAASGLIATVPASLVGGWIKTWPVRVRPLPFDVAPVEVRVLIRSTSQQSAPLKWFQLTVLDAIHPVPAELFWPPSI
jgi:DNA-binding transcriptional LysR family regulator